MTYKICSNCKWFEILSSNPNFGRCIFGLSNRDLLNNAMSSIFGGSTTEIPIVHKDDEYRCFEGK